MTEEKTYRETIKNVFNRAHQTAKKTTSSLKKTYGQQKMRPRVNNTLGQICNRDPPVDWEAAFAELQETHPDFKPKKSRISKLKEYHRLTINKRTETKKGIKNLQNELNDLQKRIESIDKDETKIQDCEEDYKRCQKKFVKIKSGMAAEILTSGHYKIKGFTKKIEYIETQLKLLKTILTCQNLYIKLDKIKIIKSSTKKNPPRAAAPMKLEKPEERPIEEIEAAEQAEKEINDSGISSDRIDRVTKERQEAYAIKEMADEEYKKAYEEKKRVSQLTLAAKEIRESARDELNNANDIAEQTEKDTKASVLRHGLKELFDVEKEDFEETEKEEEEDGEEYGEEEEEEEEEEDQF
jgi:hypothetical protein